MSTEPDADPFDALLAAARAGQTEPSADARSVALAVRQVFVALTGEGFDEQQALYLTGAFFCPKGYRP